MSAVDKLAAINSALATVNAEIPLLLVAYEGFKAIWLVANPGKTEAEYVQHLQDASANLLSHADAVLTALGYVRQADGSWRKAT